VNLATFTVDDWAALTPDQQPLSEVVSLALSPTHVYIGYSGGVSAFDKIAGALAPWSAKTLQTGRDWGKLCGGQHWYEHGPSQMLVDTKGLWLGGSFYGVNERGQSGVAHFSGTP
jgi:hypothetical protein